MEITINDNGFLEFKIVDKEYEKFFADSINLAIEIMIQSKDTIREVSDSMNTEIESLIKRHNQNKLFIFKDGAFYIKKDYLLLLVGNAETIFSIELKSYEKDFKILGEKNININQVSLLRNFYKEIHSISKDL